jgi:hypothetical protein
MELGTSWEADSCAATQELPNILWNLKVHYRVHKSPPLVPILSQINSAHTIRPISLRSILILSTNLRLGLPSGLFPSGFPTNVLYAFLFSPICATCAAHLILLDLIFLINYVSRGVQVMKLLIMQFSRISHHFISLQTKYSPQHIVLKHPQSMFPLNVRDQVSHPYRTTGKIIVLYIQIFTFLDSIWEDWTEW